MCTACTICNPYYGCLVSIAFLAKVILFEVFLRTHSLKKHFFVGGFCLERFLSRAPAFSASSSQSGYDLRRFRLYSDYMAVILLIRLAGYKFCGFGRMLASTQTHRSNREYLFTLVYIKLIFNGSLTQNPKSWIDEEKIKIKVRFALPNLFCRPFFVD